jgi:hypothetical protein
MCDQVMMNGGLLKGFETALEEPILRALQGVQG